MVKVALSQKEEYRERREKIKTTCPRCQKMREMVVRRILESGVNFTISPSTKLMNVTQKKNIS
jgi:hypothetical protein